MTGFVTDISHHQANVDLAALQAGGCAAVIFKATEGTGYVDAAFKARAAKATEIGLPWTAYHFAKPGISGPATQADHLLSVAGRDRALVLDFEDSGGISPPILASWAASFCESLEQATGRVPILYTGLGFMAGVQPRPSLARYPLWLARYTKATSTRTPAPWTSWALWQFTDNAPTPGVGPADQSRVAPGVDVAALFGLTVTPAPPPPPKPTTGGLDMPLDAETQNQISLLAEQGALRALQKYLSPDTDSRITKRFDTIDKRLSDIAAKLPKG